MAEGSISGRSDELRTIGVLLLVVLVVLAVLRSTEVPGAIDAALRTSYYGVARSSETTQRVLLVEADDDTVRDWGAPAWSDERRRDLLQRIAAGSPAAIVVLDRGRMFAPSPADDRLADGPTPPMVVELEPRLDPASSVVDSLGEAQLPSAWLDPVTRALGLPPLGTTALRINYMTPVSRLPAVGFHRVTQGDVPPSIFQDKVVVVGLTSRTHRDAIATPVGALTTPEIVSHALAMLADGRRWYEPSWLARALGTALVIVGLVLALRGASPLQALLRAVGIAVALVLLDLVLFTADLVCWGVANELLLVPTGLLVYWYRAQHSNAELIKTVSHQITEQVVEQQPLSGPAEWFWRDMAELVRTYLDLEVTAVIAELPPGRWHLEPRAFMGMTEADIYERRRDVRRPPYRSAFLTQRLARCDRRFVTDTSRYTLAVPLAHQGRMYGMWLVSLMNDVELKPAELDAMEQLGFELGRSIAEARRAEQEARAAVDAGNVTSRLSRLLSGMEALGEDKQRVLDTFDALPLGLLIADMWGHVLQQNPAIQQRLAFEFPDGIPNNDLTGLLARITNQPLTGVHELLRAAVREGKTFQLRMQRSSGREATFLLMPMRTGGSDESHTGAGSTTRLVLIAVPDLLDELMDVSIDSTPIDVGLPPSAERLRAPVVDEPTPTPVVAEPGPAPSLVSEPDLPPLVGEPDPVAEPEPEEPTVGNGSGNGNGKRKRKRRRRPKAAGRDAEPKPPATTHGAGKVEATTPTHAPRKDAQLLLRSA